jgi:Holliday junction DNA helicase RuvA
MISLLEGKIINNYNGELTIMTSGGVGYKAFASPRTQERCAVGNNVILNVYLIVREDALDLFAFADSEEQALFKYFLSVSGVGPKTALHLLDLGTVNEISSAIAREDVEYLTKVSGIGKKTAERIVVELKAKMKDQGARSSEQAGEKIYSSALNDVIDGLIALGYSANEAREVVKSLKSEGKTSEQLLKEALQHIK